MKIYEVTITSREAEEKEAIGFVNADLLKVEMKLPSASRFATCTVEANGNGETLGELLGLMVGTLIIRNKGEF